MLFGGTSPEHIGDPLRSAYSLFKVFTVEGWHEIPDDLKKNGADDVQVMLLRVYFVVAVLIGGILGLSLANAVFVDEMTSGQQRSARRDGRRASRGTGGGQDSSRTGSSGALARSG